MFGGGDQDALAHQAGGVADARHVAPEGGDGKIVEVGPEKNDAGGGRRRKNADRDGNAAVKPDSLGLYWPLDGGLKPQCGFLWVFQLSRFARFYSNRMFHFTRD
jgi:hypothetical protein